MLYEGLDAVLVQGLRRGSNAAAQQLIDVYSAPLYQYLRRRCLCEEDALDVLSMVFQKAVASAHSFDETRGSFKNWLYHVAQTSRADFYRCWGGSSGSELPADDLLEAREGDASFGEPWKYLMEEGPEEGISRLTRAVEEVFARMPPRYVEVLQLAHTDLTREEIARLLGVTREHLRVLINRASTRFKQIAQQHRFLADWLARAEPLPAEDEEEPDFDRRQPTLVRD
ncbi:MAG: sigma-70 family RNA polymerase sigma factor [Armatimonadetes bacterium]|nr:sigma-70 family RNA polymerase sigma factor [Armatimonadota bacterium]